MKRPILWILFALALGSVAVLVIVSVVSVSFFPNHVDKNEVAYSANTTIDGYVFQVTLFRNHPMLAEYRKLLQVKRAEKLILEREFFDTGGLASFYFLRRGDRIVVLDGLRDGFVLEIPTGEISEIDLDSIPTEFPAESFGRFMFVNQPDHSYRWVAKEDLPHWVK